MYFCFQFSAMNVQDPFVMNHNITANVNHKTFIHILDQLQQAVAKSKRQVPFLDKPDQSASSAATSSGGNAEDWGLTYLWSPQRVLVQNQKGELGSHSTMETLASVLHPQPGGEVGAGGDVGGGDGVVVGSMGYAFEVKLHYPIKQQQSPSKAKKGKQVTNPVVEIKPGVVAMKRWCSEAGIFIKKVYEEIFFMETAEMEKDSVIEKNNAEEIAMEDSNDSSETMENSKRRSVDDSSLIPQCKKSKCDSDDSAPMEVSPKKTETSEKSEKKNESKKDEFSLNAFMSAILQAGNCEVAVENQRPTVAQLSSLPKDQANVTEGKKFTVICLHSSARHRQWMSRVNFRKKILQNDPMIGAPSTLGPKATYEIEKRTSTLMKNVMPSSNADAKTSDPIFEFSTLIEAAANEKEATLRVTLQPTCEPREFKCFFTFFRSFIVKFMDKCLGGV